jgi:hypothetical protein
MSRFFGHVRSIGLVRVDGANSRWIVSVLNSDYRLGPYGGQVYIDGTLEISNAGLVSVADALFIDQGTVRGNGNILGNVQNGGLILPGNSLGALHISGNYSQTSAGKLLIELAGTTPGTQYDQLLITGGATLDGTLQVSLLNGFVPSAGDSFDLLTTTSSIAGTFANEQLPLLAGGLIWNLSYGPNDVILSVGGVLGDYNHNGIVDAADYVVWRKGLGTTYTQADYNIWRAHFGQTAGSGSGAIANAAVPEPATTIMMIVGMLAMSCRRRAAVP